MLYSAHLYSARRTALTLLKISCATSDYLLLYIGRFKIQKISSKISQGQQKSVTMKIKRELKI